MNIIFDTDMALDVDDAGALALLHALADNGEANILGTMVSSDHFWSPGAVDAINTYYGRPDIPIGAFKGGVQTAGQAYVQAVAQGGFGNDVVHTGQVPEAVDVYREILANSPDDSVTIVTVGFLTNLSELLDSGPDAFSPLTGQQLVDQKVNSLVTMGGRYPNPNLSWEFNFAQGGSGTFGVGPYTKNTVDNWPTPSVFSGGELGETIFTGAALAGTPTTNPVRRGYEVYFGAVGVDRESWDQTAVYYAVRGVDSTFGPLWDHSPVGTNLIPSSNGRNTWSTSASDDRYLLPDASIPVVEFVLESLMVQAPALGDFDRDGDVDLADAILGQKQGNPLETGSPWDDRFGAGESPIGAVTAVPEPASLALIGISACLSAGRRTRRA